MTFARSRGRPRLNKIPVQVQLSPELVSALKTSKPELLKPGTTNFRHGALSTWVEALLWTELRKPKYATQILGNSQSGRVDGGRETLESSRGFPGQSVRAPTAFSRGDSDPSGSVGSAEEGNRDCGHSGLQPNCPYCNGDGK